MVVFAASWFLQVDNALIMMCPLDRRPSELVFRKLYPCFCFRDSKQTRAVVTIKAILDVKHSCGTAPNPRVVAQLSGGRNLRTEPGGWGQQDESSKNRRGVRVVRHAEQVMH
jgi:hypothetical protein